MSYNLLELPYIPSLHHVQGRYRIDLFVFVSYIKLVSNVLGVICNEVVLWFNKFHAFCSLGHFIVVFLSPECLSSGG